MAKSGRPLKLTDEITEEIAGALSIGLTRETAARYAHITPQTFLNWYKRGKKEAERVESGTSAKAAGVTAKAEAPFLNFFRQVEDAEITAITEWQQTVNRHAKLDPIFALKMLSLRDPKGYRPAPAETVNYDLAALVESGQIGREHLVRIINGEDPAIVLAEAGASAAAAAGHGQPSPS